MDHKVAREQLSGRRVMTLALKRALWSRRGTFVAPDARLPDGFIPPSAALAPACTHLAVVPVNELDGPLREPGRLVAWLCPDCDAQLDPGFRASELRPDGSWPAVRRRVR